MSDFLSSLMARSFRAAPAIKPRLPSLFESAAAPAGGLETDIVVERGPRRPAAPSRRIEDAATVGNPAAHLASIADPVPAQAAQPLLSAPPVIAARRAAVEPPAPTPEFVSRFPSGENFL